MIETCLAGPDTDDLLDTPKILQEIQTARSSEMRLESLIELGKELLANLPAFEETVSKVTTALKDAERKRQYLLESWVNIYFFLHIYTYLYIFSYDLITKDK